jgi:hypothetical protein
MGEIQSIRFRRPNYTVTKANQWMKKHKYKLLKGKKVDITPNWLRYRIKHPDNFSHFATKVLSNNIEMIIGFF